jgi:hypothetical protein
VIDVSTPAKPVARTRRLQGLQQPEGQLLAKGVRTVRPQTAGTAVVANDLEPEYIAVAPDGKTAWVTLQENNAGHRGHRQRHRDRCGGTGLQGSWRGNELDFADSDGKSPVIDITQAANVLACTSRTPSPPTRPPTVRPIWANEGDARAWGEGNKSYFGTPRRPTPRPRRAI